MKLYSGIDDTGYLCSGFDAWRSNNNLDDSPKGPMGIDKALIESIRIDILSRRHKLKEFEGCIPYVNKDNDYLKKVGQFREYITIQTEEAGIDYAEVKLDEIPGEDIIAAISICGENEDLLTETQIQFDDIPLRYRYKVNALCINHPNWVFDYYYAGISLEEMVNAQYDINNPVPKTDTKNYMEDNSNSIANRVDEIRKEFSNYKKTIKRNGIEVQVKVKDMTNDEIRKCFLTDGAFFFAKRKAIEHYVDPVGFLDGKYYYDSFGKNVKLTFTLDGEKEKKAVAIYAHMASLPYEIERELINQIEKHNLENPKKPPIIYSDIGESCWDSKKKVRRKPVGKPEIFKVSNIEVSKGDVLGYGGNTGYSIGSHLHFELHVENESENSVDKEPDMKLVNPDDYIKFPWES